MADPYTPLLADLVLSDEEQDAITVALGTKHPWNHDCQELAGVKQHLKSVKDKLADYHMLRHDGTCCYCGSILAGGGPFVRDREHVLPKGKFPKLSYDPFNLSVSCKRCNLQYKGERTDFVLDPATVEDEYQKSERYKIVHPNLDRWEDYLGRVTVQKGRAHVTFFTFDPQVEKAAYTYQFFGLVTLEVSNFDKAQGLKSVREIVDWVSDELPDRI